MDCPVLQSHAKPERFELPSSNTTYRSARLQFDGPTALVDEVASIFVEAFDTAAPGDDSAAARIVRLHEKLHALGLMSRRQA